MYEIEPDPSFDETEAAKRYWASRELRSCYTADKRWAHHMADRVAEFNPHRVLEFGCGAGRNLKTIRDRFPGIDLVGVDINPKAVDVGRDKWGLDLHVGDESWLSSQPNYSFDVLFTVSVFDHLPNPQPVLKEAARVAPVLLFLEPWLGTEGKVVRAPGPGGEVTQATPYSYSWDYETRLRAEGLTVTSYPYSIGEAGLGASYRVFEAHR